MPVNAAGCRIEPPVSVPVAPSARCAATAAADPPDEPPGTSGVFEPFRRRGEVPVGQLGGGEFPLLQAVARIRDGERGQLAHSGSSQENPDLAAWTGAPWTGAAFAGGAGSSPCGITVTSHCHGCALRLASSTASR